MGGLTEAIGLTYAYAVWADERVLAEAERLSPEQLTAPRAGGFGSIRDTLVHIVDARRAWLERLREQPLSPEPDPADFPTVASVRELWRQVDAFTGASLAAWSEDDLRAIVSWRGDQDQIRSFPRWQMLLHQTNHAMQHRSELALLLTELGHSPGELDLSRYLRERAATAAE